MTLRREFVSSGLACALGAGGILKPATSIAAIETADEWATRPASGDGIDQAAIDKILDDAGALSPLRSVLVVRSGALMAERYYGGANASDLQAVNSATKSVASMLVGIALEQGKIRSTSQTIDALLPQAVAKAPGAGSHGITLEQILTGTTGLVYDFRTQQRELDTADDPVGYALSLPVNAEKPARWVYNDAAVALISPILVHAQGMSVEELVKRDLFSPLGIDRFAGARDKAGNAMSYRGLRLHARDFAKIAWTMANDGKWGDTQVVPAEWVKRSTTFHVPTLWGAAPIRRAGYGYLWFTGNLNGHPVAWAWGYGAQFALIAPSLRLAITTTASNPAPASLLAQTDAVMTLVARIVALAS